jgi:hypothetical protein
MPVPEAEQQSLDMEVPVSHVPHGDAHGAQPRGEARLDEVIASAWRSLELGQTVCCPVCGGSLDPYDFGEIEAPEGMCMDCGSELW